MHAKTLWACDFVYKKVWMPRGLVTTFVLVFMHVASRRVWASPATTRPNGAWAAEQARAFAWAAAKLHLPHVERFIGRLKRECLGSSSWGGGTWTTSRGSLSATTTAIARTP
jgi:hypothetical protein